MARTFEFSGNTKKNAKARQNDRCAICGQNLDKTGNPFQAHHIVSAKYGGDDSLDNCVILCIVRDDESDGCHLYAHADDYRSKFQLDKNRYKYLHG